MANESNQINQVSTNEQGKPAANSMGDTAAAEVAGRPYAPQFKSPGNSFTQL